MFELFRDGRSTNRAIARKLGLSTVTVAREINAIIKSDFISIRAVPNPVKMGNHAGALVCLNVDLRKIDAICAELKRFPNIHIMATTFGRFDLLLITFFHDMTALENFVKARLHSIDGIRSSSTFFISEIKMGNAVSFNSIPQEDAVYDLDSMDWEIISELMENGRPRYTDLAKRLQTSKATVSRRISSLLEEDIIKIVAIPNTNLEYLANAFVLINAEFSKIDDICEKLVSYPETHLVFKLMNDHDIFLTMNSISREELYKFIANKVACIEGVIKNETFLLANFLHFNANAMLCYSDEVDFTVPVQLKPGRDK